ncbi:Complex I assembly factor TIMMDC1 [Sarcoptes scabiei]|uniref:Complex I assembly factor TIMMDC1, mitochondrial n=1 Tax=Sarcoptes scabiei TaxID=52283 RepID=A0A834RBI0_SARSC|nr:Complex I assembly factor TIMMDC1 [Sarcoptes scabiei]
MVENEGVGGSGDGRSRFFSTLQQIFNSNQSIISAPIPENPDETGLDRLKDVWKAFNSGEKCFESRIISNAFAMGGIAGICIGALIKNREMFARYIQEHNTMVFEGKYRAKRQMVDRMYIELTKRSIRYGIHFSLFSGMFVTSLTLSTAYRNDIYLRDCAMSGLIFGMIWRAHLGSRAALVTGFLGAIFGFTFGGITKMMLSLAGTSIKDLRNLSKIESEMMNDGDDDDYDHKL